MLRSIAKSPSTTRKSPEKRSSCCKRRASSVSLISPRHFVGSFSTAKKSTPRTPGQRTLLLTKVNATKSTWQIEGEPQPPT